MERIPFVDLKAQYRAIKSEIDEAIQRIIDNTAFIGGRAVLEFEEAFAKFCGAKYAVGVGNGTDVLALAPKALGVGPGDEVITVPNTFIATIEAITMVGADIVFVDVHPGTYNMDFRQLEEKITRRTKAVIPVHLYGQVVDMDPKSTQVSRVDGRDDRASGEGCPRDDRLRIEFVSRAGLNPVVNH